MSQDTLGLNSVIHKLTYVVDTPCPQCGGEMRAWRDKDRNGNPKCAPVCMNKSVDEFGRTDWVGCGYKSKNKKDALSNEKLFDDSLKRKCEEYTLSYSEVGDKGLLKRLLADYRPTGAESEQAVEVANKIAQNIINGEITHAMFLGPTGTGKTHLSVGILNEYMRETKYVKRGVVVSYVEMNNLARLQFQDDLKAKRLGELMREIKTCDLVVLDDLGAELGVIQKDTKPTDNNVTLLQQIADAREDRHLIVTSNFKSNDIKTLYGERVFSRIKKHLRDSKGEWNAVSMTQTTDYRGL